MFLRLAACNLTCKGYSYVGPDGIRYGCDSTLVWQKGTRKSFEQIVEEWDEQGWFGNLRQGAHLIYSGGEPLLQQTAVARFSCWVVAHYLPATFVEIETNGTIVPTDEFNRYVNHYSVSPKLSNGGDPKEKRYKPEVLRWHVANPTSTFKFVVCTKEDMRELVRDFLEPFHISRERIWLMPEGATGERLSETSKVVADLCKQYGFQYSPRLHIWIWGQVTGV